jgi:integrase
LNTQQRRLDLARGLFVVADHDDGRSAAGRLPDRAATFKQALTAALKAAAVAKSPRPFHDLRHTAITNDAAAGSSPIAVMTKAGHANMSTTKRYIHLAGVVFADEALALERRLLGAGLSTEPSTRLTAPEPTEHDRAPLNHA